MKQCMDAENLHRRLKKIIGQVQAIDRMVDEDIPCEDILSLATRKKPSKNLPRPLSALPICSKWKNRRRLIRRCLYWFFDKQPFSLYCGCFYTPA